MGAYNTTDCDATVAGTTREGRDDWNTTVVETTRDGRGYRNTMGTEHNNFDFNLFSVGSSVRELPPRLPVLPEQHLRIAFCTI